VYGTGSRICNARQPIFLSARSLACSVVLVRMRGRTAATQLQRQDADGWTTLYQARDTLPVPIAEAWAYTSAPSGQPFASGSYRCRFLVDGRVAATKLLSVRS
jgi:hypothetical protein